MLPEQDVIDAIVHTLKILPVEIKFSWVKGHQDETTEYTRLPLPAQLNCDADTEASRYKCTNATHRRMNTPLPGTPSQLFIQQQSITSHIKRRVREAVAIPRLHQYLQNRFEWDDTTRKSIDWQTYTHIIQRYKEHWTTIVKHLHFISPTGHIAHRNNSHLPHECPACSTPFENNLHVITCSHRSRLSWRDSTMRKISQYEPNKSDPHLLDILRDGLCRLHRELPSLPPDEYPEKYRSLIQSQNRIGWEHLYCGRWSNEWVKQHAQYSVRNGQPGTEKESSTWLLRLGRMLIDQWLLLWKLRNDQRHGKDQAHHTQLREHILHSELRELYEYKTRVCPADRSLFHGSAAEHIERHPKLEAIEDWIQAHRDAILASTILANRLGISRNRTLQEYPAFNPIAPAGR